MPVPASAPTDPDRPCQPTSLPAPRAAPPPLACGVTTALGANSGSCHQPCLPCSHGDGCHAGLPTGSFSFLPYDSSTSSVVLDFAWLLLLDHKHRHFARSSIALRYCCTIYCLYWRQGKKWEMCCQAWWLSLSTASVQTGFKVKWWQNPMRIKVTAAWTMHTCCSHTVSRRGPLCTALLSPPVFFDCTSSPNSFPAHSPGF